MLRCLIFAAALPVLAAPAALAQEAPKEAAPAEATRLTAKVNGMVCDFCAQAVNAVFGKEAAVETVEVDLDGGEIRIGLKPGQSLSDARVEELVKKSGYDLVEIARPSA